ncbi:MAG: VirB3 family type IV secretion system protein [Succinivibrionaceae bacterium]|nr:VirB3 family type IV secretion system protein [Succinivibrionaceae bacterium]
MSTHRIYGSIRQQHTFMGCDRELSLITLLVLIPIPLFLWSGTVLLASLGLAAAALTLLRRMARHDLLLRKVYLRSLRYAPFYSARPLPRAARGR